MKILWLTLFFALFLSVSLHSQFIALQKGDKVEIRDIKGGYITGGYYSGLKDITQGENIIVLWYESGKVELRDYGLRYLTASHYSNLKKIGATADYVVLSFENGKIEVRDDKLGYISSWYQ